MPKSKSGEPSENTHREIGERSYTMIVRAKLARNGKGTLSDFTGAVTRSGGDTGNIHVVKSTADYIVRDFDVSARDVKHGEKVIEALKAVPGVEIVNVSDVVFLKHLGGKISITPTSEVKNSVDLAQVYTPEVARVCMAIHANPEKAANLTIKGKMVAVVSDGSRVLALGNIGALAALPVMEGKAMLFKRFANVDAFPICLNTQNADEIVAAVKAIAPNFGAINLEDIESPRCYEVERRLREALDIPVFHDDQHGTAIVVGAAALNAARFVKKPMSRLKVVAVGTGAAGMACIKMLIDLGVKDIIAYNKDGAVYKGAPNLTETEQWLAENSNPGSFKGTYKEALKGRDMFLGLSVGGILTGKDLNVMNKKAIVFALANPQAEVDPEDVPENVVVMATGSSRYPNQINNALAFPGIFSGALEARVKQITDDMSLEAARSLAGLIKPAEISGDYVIPSVFDARVATTVADAVKRIAVKT
ncbi:MAG: NAD-dependent malic enzyme, partial [Cyanobacteria bacterium REEB67]|nr:NAD-dependent malic enzyme [Cyanobacteria bacterium REEB67]